MTLRHIPYRTLILNRNYMPMSIWPLSTEWASEEILRVMTGDCDVVYNYDKKVKCSRDDLYWPSVTVNNRYMPADKTLRPKKHLLYYRDHCVCMYCGDPIELKGNPDNPKSMTKDHVIPQSKGGKDEWENLISACKSCNAKKRDKDAKGQWAPKIAPHKPTYAELLRNRSKHPIVIHDERWAEFLPNWSGEMILKPYGYDYVPDVDGS